jgi:putative transposase
MSEFSLKSETEIRAYCLMPNHVHLVMEPAEKDGLRSILGEAHRRYTGYINFHEGWRCVDPMCFARVDIEEEKKSEG